MSPIPRPSRAEHAVDLEDHTKTERIALGLRFMPHAAVLYVKGEAVRRAPITVVLDHEGRDFATRHIQFDCRREWPLPSQHMTK